MHYVKPPYEYMTLMDITPLNARSQHMQHLKNIMSITAEKDSSMCFYSAQCPVRTVNICILLQTISPMQICVCIYIWVFYRSEAWQGQRN